MSFSPRDWTKSSIFLLDILPISFATKVLVITSSFFDNWSKILKASLSPPSAKIAISFKPSSSYLIFSSSQTNLSLSTMSLSVILWNSNLWHLETIVIGTLSKFVVARINITCSGGSSKVSNNALKALWLNIWTSSII